MILVIDARRADPAMLEATLASAPADCEIWVRCHEPLSSSKRVSKWRVENSVSGLVPSELRAENANRSIVLAEAGDVSFPTDPDSTVFRCREIDPATAASWRGWVFVPRRHLWYRPRKFTERLLNGIVQIERTSAPSSIPTFALAKKPALLLAPADFDRLTGGLRFHIEESLERLQKVHFVYLLSPNEREGFTLRAFLDGGRSVTSLVPTRTESEFRELVRRIKPDVVHFHHFQGFPLSFVGIARRLAKATCVSLHDDHAYSDRERRNEFRAALKGVPKIVHSNGAKSLFVKYLKLAADEIEVRTVSLPTTTSPTSTRRTRRTRSGVFAFIGPFTRENGAFIFETIVRNFAKLHPELKWKVFGAIRESALALDLEENFDVEFFGPCSRDRLQRLLRSEEVDFALVLPASIDFSPHAVVEARAAGCRLVVTDLGAPAESVKREGDGSVLRLDAIETDFAAVIRNSYSIPIEPAASLRNTRSLNA